MRRVLTAFTALRRGLGVAAAAGALAACSTVGGDQGGAQAPAQQDSLATKLLMGNANPPPAAPPVDLAIKRECPPVDILDGTASYPVYDSAGSTDPFSLRYQATIAQTARECSNLGVEAGIRVGVVGRVVIGPKGAPGIFRLPLRVAVLDERDQPQYSQNFTVEATVPAGQGQARFTQIIDNIVVPIPENRFRGWRIVVGYDPKGAAPDARAARKRG
ncbi:hypothetical protein [Hansschlegelia sp. KR7-227]|jgi:hypothetical protein|uniref:hypothetical protein n=1 Tax=Hansschlegelia sp. KR7-227 TaxID=3400914 RepID=UPI003BFF4DA1